MPDSSGTLRVRTYTAGGALPVANAIVRITGVSEDNRLISFSSTTDQDGLSGLFTLPTPPLNLSLSPNAAELPYSVYDLEVTADGYYSKTIRGLTVFSGVNSIQLINMIPGSGKMVEDYPRGNLTYIIPDNEDLQ